MLSEDQGQQARLRSHLEQVRARIAAACVRSGRPPDAVRLVAVTKTVPPETIEALFRLGQRDFGENRPQQLVERSRWLAERDGETVNAGSPDSLAVTWHLIGQLQSNKIRSVRPAAGLIHSVDSWELLQRIGRVGGELGLVPEVLLQVNVSGEATKGGFAPEELRAEWGRIDTVDSVRISGLMTMAPFTADERVLRETFRGLRLLRDELEQHAGERILPELSMGMSNDFEIAIEEGATLVRLGSILFADDPAG